MTFSAPATGTGTIPAGMLAQGAEDGQDAAFSLIDVESYPLVNPGSPRLQSAIDRARDALDRDGCAILHGFIRPEAKALLSSETARLSVKALYSHEVYTPYGSGPDDAFPEGHPRRRGHRTTSGSVTRDLIPEETAIQTLYRCHAFQRLIAACLEAEQLYPFADPMRGLIVNTMAAGSALHWHFDANEFVVSLLTRRATEGGRFEYCPNIRAPGNENYTAVQEVLDGQSDRVRRLDLSIGDLQIFKGRYSLHRVCPVEAGARDSVIFGYARDPGFIGSVESTLRVYGRVMRAHLDADARRHSDGLAD